MPRETTPSPPVVTMILVTLNVAIYPFITVADCEKYGLNGTCLDGWHLLSSLFLHDPRGMAHLGMNVLLLAIFGTLAESQLGHLRFAALYVAAGCLGGFMHTMVDPQTVLVGASGAIFGSMALVAAMRPKWLAFVSVMALIEVWAALSGGVEGVSFGAHLGGFAAGAVFAVVLRMTRTEAAE